MGSPFPAVAVVSLVKEVMALWMGIEVKVVELVAVEAMAVVVDL